jgi:ABC-type multidrug transport system ATPase subunit
MPAYTEHLIASQQATLQVLHQGKAIQAADVDAGGLAITGPGLPPAPSQAQLALAGLAPSVYATIRLEPSDAVLRTEDYAVHQNLEPVAPHAAVVLKDKDLLTIPDAPDVSMLFLDPRRIPERNLSDLLVQTDRLTIGTAESNSCRLFDPSLSRVHAEIWRERGELFVRDLGSRNGTAIDGRRVRDTVERLAAGSRLTLGRLPFRVDAAAIGASAAPPPLPSVDVRVVEVSADIAGKRRLHGVSIGVGQGEMVGLLGPSASGKSTLLKVLAGEQPIAGGELYVNGRSMRQNSGRWNWFTSLMGYRGDAYEVGFVQQIDLIQPDLTVREVLEYAGRHMGLPNDTARQRAVDAAGLCNLGPLMDRVALLGNGRMNLSGGQLKRVCVAVEILRQPRILLLDEPTTGQDPKNTDDLMKLFRSVAQRGVTLLMSTHDLRNLVVFDKVAALCLGRLVYFGPPTEFAEYFGASSPEEVYDSLPDREDREAEAQALAARFRQTPHYRRYCEALP